MFDVRDARSVTLCTCVFHVLYTIKVSTPSTSHLHRQWRLNVEIIGKNFVEDHAEETNAPPRHLKIQQIYQFMYCFDKFSVFAFNHRCY